MAKQRIGIFGCSFDPVHCGHLQAARATAAAAKLDRVLMLPTGFPGYRPVTEGADDRWRMLVAACRGDSLLVPCQLALDREKLNHSANTVPLIREQYPDAKLYWIIGTDAFLRMKRRVRVEDVFRECKVLVCRRPDEADGSILAAEAESLQKAGARVQVLDIGIPAYSSGAVRRAYREKREPEGVDVCVREYIECKGLYGFRGRVAEAEPWLNRLFSELKPHRFAHSLAVADTARLMAARFGEDPAKAEKAGLLHDCAKHMPLEEMQRIAKENRLDADREFLASSSLLHSVVGAFVAQRDYGMKDPEILEAITYHNTGHAGMSRLAMCVCLSDSIEPTRASYPMLEEVRALAERSLEKALLLSLEGTARFVSKKGMFLHPRTQETIAWLKTLPAVRE